MWTYIASNAPKNLFNIVQSNIFHKHSMLINVDKDSDASTLQIPDSVDQQWIFKRQKV